MEQRRPAHNTPLVSSWSPNTLTHKTINDLSNYVDADALHQKFYNNSGGVLVPGTAVVNTQWNAANNATEVVKARANSGTTCPCHGLVEATTADGAVGEIRTHGILNNVDTSAWSEGVDLWLSPATAGALTTTEPITIGQYKQFIGTVVKQHATTGIIAVQLGPALLITASAGGAVSVAQTTVDCGTTGVWSKDFTISDAAVSGVSHIIANVAALATTNNDADEIATSGVFAVAGLPSAGSFVLSLFATDGPISGQFKVNYLVG